MAIIKINWSMLRKQLRPRFYERLRRIDREQAILELAAHARRR